MQTNKFAKFTSPASWLRWTPHFVRRPLQKSVRQIMNSTENHIKGIENPKLVAAILSHFESSSNESADELMGYLMTAKYLCGLIDNNLDVKDGVAQKGSKISIGLIEDEDGKMLLPLHTDWVHLSQSEPGKDGMVMTAEMAYSMALENYDGIVINPSGYALPLNRNILETLLARLNA